MLCIKRKDSLSVNRPRKFSNQKSPEIIRQVLWSNHSRTVTLMKKISNVRTKIDPRFCERNLVQLPKEAW